MISARALNCAHARASIRSTMADDDTRAPRASSNTSHENLPPSPPRGCDSIVDTMSSALTPASKVFPALAGFIAVAYVPYYMVNVRKVFGGAAPRSP